VEAVKRHVASIKGMIDEGKALELAEQTRKAAFQKAKHAQGTALSEDSHMECQNGTWMDRRGFTSKATALTSNITSNRAASMTTCTLSDTPTMSAKSVTLLECMAAPPPGRMLSRPLSPPPPQQKQHNSYAAQPLLYTPAAATAMATAAAHAAAAAVAAELGDDNDCFDYFKK